MLMSNNPHLRSTPTDSAWPPCPAAGNPCDCLVEVDWLRLRLAKAMQSLRLRLGLVNESVVVEDDGGRYIAFVFVVDIAKMITLFL